MKKISLLIMLFIVTITLVACGDEQSDIVVTMFPQYDIVKNIVKDELKVTMLTDPGVGSHGYEPTSKEIISVYESKLFIYTSEEFDSWINIQNLQAKDVNSLDLSSLAIVPEHNHNHETSTKKTNNHDHGHGHEHSENLHYWTDPLVYIELIEGVLEKIIELSNDKKELFTQNAKDYIKKITDAHIQLDTLLHSKNATIYFAGHNGMELFADRYHITIHALNNTSKPDADITDAQLRNLVDLLKGNNVNHLFTEELIDPKIANKIKDELKKSSIDLQLLELHSYHNVTKNDFDNNITYYDLLVRNYNNLKQALGE